MNCSVILNNYYQNAPNTLRPTVKRRRLFQQQARHSPHEPSEARRSDSRRRHREAVSAVAAAAVAADR